MKFVAIITYGRTGSTVLQAALNAFPGVLVRGENRNIFRSFESLVRTAASVKLGYGRDAENAGNPWFGADLLESKELLNELRGLAIRQVLKPHEETHLLGFKEIRYEPEWFSDFDDLLHYLLFLCRLFPGIRFVVNRRDPIETAKSGWWPGVLNSRERLETAYQWLGNLPEYLQARLNRSAAILTSYEVWKANPHSLSEVWEFLDIPWDFGVVAEALSRKLDH